MDRPNIFTRRVILEDLLEQVSGDKVLSSFIDKTSEILERLSAKPRLDILRRKLSAFKHQFKLRWIKASRCKKKFFQQNDAWLNGEVKLFRPADHPPIPKSKGACFDRGQSAVSKRRKTAQLRQENSADALTFAAQMKLREEGKVLESKWDKFLFIHQAYEDSKENKWP